MQSRIVSIDFIDNLYHGDHYNEEGGTLLDGSDRCHDHVPSILDSVRRFQRKTGDTGDDVRNDETEADAVERVLARVENYPFETELLLVDSSFFNERVIRRSREIAATVVHVPKKGDRMKEKLAQLVHDDLSVDSAGGVTTICDPAVRFGFRLVAAILENLWLMLRWAVLARTGAGASDLKTEEFTFSVLCDWIWKEPEEQLERRWEIKMNGNGTGILASYQTTAG